MTSTCSTIIICLLSLALFGQSPANLHSDILASHGFDTTLDIESTFNNARRQEEIQLGLPTNSIRNLNLPSDPDWNAMTDEAKMLFLLNDERIARANIDYGSGPVKGLPFAGVAQGVDKVSNDYAQTLFNAGAFTHTYNGTSPSSRLAAEYTSTCKEFTSRSENLYLSVSSSNTGFPRAVEKAVYGFNYDDAGSNWGHREMNLLQDLDLNGRPWGFTDNEGSIGSEGYIGVGVYRSTSYNRSGRIWPYGVVLVLNYIDPSPNCGYTLIEENGNPTTDPCDEPVILTSSALTEVISSNHSVVIGGGVSFDKATTISAPQIDINSGFSLGKGTCIQIVNDGCNYNGSFTCEPTDPGDNEISGSGTCSSPYIIACNQNHLGSNIGFTNNWSLYGNTVGWTGGEVIYELSLSAGESRLVSLSHLTADLDLLLATSCSAYTVALSSTLEGLASETLNFSTNSGGTFYLIIDGWDGAQGSYELSVTCSSQLSSKEVSTKSKSSVQKVQEIQMLGRPYLERSGLD